MKRSFLIFLSVIMILSCAGSALAGPQADPAMDASFAAGSALPMEQEGESFDPYISVCPLDQIMEDSGLTWRQWDQRAEEMRSEGLSDALTLEDLQEADPDLQVMTSKDQVVGLIGERIPLIITDTLDANQTVFRLVGLLGGGEETQLLLQQVLRIGDETIYVFQEIFEGHSVIASTVRLITDPDGHIQAVFSSLQPSIPDGIISAIAASEAAEPADIVGVDADQAEQIVKEYYKQSDTSVEVFTDFTAQILVPQEEDEDEEEETFLPDLLMWVVYTDNPSYPALSGPAYPYLANYLSFDGTWLYSNEVKVPGDEAGQSGYLVPYLFEQMEEATWSGTVTRFDGTTMEIAVPVMKDTQTGIYYLGDVERRIAFGEYYEFAYDEEELILLSSENNTDWNDDDLITYYNYLMVWDTYAQKGWTGPDGSRTPSLILRGMSLENGEEADNAAYCGHYRGWQIFAYDNSTSFLGEGLDVIAHEYTHCVTQTLQGENLYYDDYGSINESLSDIMGSLCEMAIEGASEGDWLLGEDTTETIRSMLDPHYYEQPEYVWDVFYGPHAYHPNDANDRGGVHSNSSILNLLAAKLCTEYDMSAEEAWSFWLMQCSLQTPMTDLVQMASMLPVALSLSGNDRYRTPLMDLIEAGRLIQTQFPESVEEGKCLVNLSLPDTETFSDDHWMLMAVQVRENALGDIFSRLAGIFTILTDEEESAGDNPSPQGGLLDHVLIMQNSWVSDEENCIHMVINDRRTLYFLVNIDTDTLEIRNMAMLLKDQWLDLSGMVSGQQTVEAETTDEAEAQALIFLLNSGLEIGRSILSQLFSEDDIVGTVIDGNVVTLSTLGLERIELAEVTEE